MALSFKKKSPSADAGDSAPAVAGDAENAGKKKPAKEKKTKATKVKKPVKARGKRFVYFIGDDGCILIFMDENKVVRRLFAPSAQPSHTEAMLELMKANATVPIYILLDVLDQQYVSQTFPPVNSVSVPGLVKRRLERDFAPDDLKNYMPLGREKDGRKEWRFLLIAISNTPIISEWLNLLIDLPNELKGVYLVPVETLNYVKALNNQLGKGSLNSWHLLISHNKVSGFRQVVLNNGKLVFTRVSQAIDEAIPAVVAGNIEQEIINTMEYLKRLDFKVDSDLDATVIVSQEVSDALDLNRFGFGSSKILTPLRVSEALGLDQAALSADRFGDVVMAAAFAIEKKKVLRFSTAYLDKLAKLYQAQLGIKVVAALVVIAMLGLSIMSGLDIFTTQAEIEKFKNESVTVAGELAAQQKLVDGLNQDVAFKSAIVTTSDVYLKNTSYPADIAKLMAASVKPSARIISYDWSQSDPSEGKATPADQLPVTVTIKVDFDLAGSKPELVSAAADAFFQSLKTSLVDYEVTSKPYPWVLAQGATEQLDLAQAANLPADKKIAEFVITGPKKGAAR